MAGKVTLVRTIWPTNPSFASVPPLGCGAPLALMLIIDGEGAVPKERIPQLRATLELATVVPTDFQGAVAVITGILTAFNAANGTSYIVDSACSLPGHVSTGANGCRPGNGHALLLNNSNPPRPGLSTNFVVGSLSISHGLIVSIQY